MIDLAMPDTLQLYGHILEELKGIREKMDHLSALQLDHANTKESLGRAFRDIEALETRINVVEKQMPLLSLVNRWALGIVTVMIMGLVGSVITLVLKGNVYVGVAAAPPSFMKPGGS